MAAIAPGYVQDNVFIELGLANLPDEQKVELLGQMNDLVHKRTMLRIAESLPDDAKAAVAQMAGKSDQEQLETILKFVPNLPELILEEVDRVKVEMKASLGEITSQAAA
jgi:hypothetical protein